MTFKSYLCIFYHCYFTILMVSIRLPRYCILQDSISKKCFFRFTAYKTSKIFLTWCFCPGLVTLLAAVGRVFPWRFLAPQAALQEKRSSIFGVMKFRNSVNRAFINYGRHLIDGGWRVTKCKQKRKNQNVLAAHSQLFCSLLSPSRFPVPLPLCLYWNSEIQLAMKSSHSSLILWPISQCWWWCIINISINQDQLGISTDWMSLRQRGKKIRRFLKSMLSVVFFTFHLFVSVHYFHFWIWVQLGSLKRDV